MEDKTDFETIRASLLAGDDETAWLALREYLERLLYERIEENRMDQVHEALQEVIVTLLKYRRTGYLQRIRSLSSYCAAIALRRRSEVAVSEAERRRTERPLDGCEEHSHPDPLEILLVAEFRSEIRRAFDILTPAQKEVMMLHLREGLTAEQIARRLAKAGRPRSLASVLGLIKRARKSLRKYLEDNVLCENPGDRD